MVTLIAGQQRMSPVAAGKLKLGVAPAKIVVEGHPQLRVFGRKQGDAVITEKYLR